MSFDFDFDTFYDDQRKLTSKAKTKLELYRTDALVVRSYKPTCAGSTIPRGQIGRVPSKRSLQRLVFVLNNCDIPFTSMLTLTMTPQVHRDHTARVHCDALKASLQRLRRSEASQYCWVREFQNNGSVHWHIFTDHDVEQSGEVNEELSRDWSKWFANYYGERKATKRSVTLMTSGNRRDFKGCTRYEQLKSEAAGLYAAKEGAKRYQKKAPRKWWGGGRWWATSYGLTCTPLGTIDVKSSTLDTCEINVNGETREIAFKIQYSRGLKECSRA